MNKSIADEIATVHIHFFQFHSDNQGAEKLSKLFLCTVIEEMGYIERCAERILFRGWRGRNDGG